MRPDWLPHGACLLGEPWLIGYFAVANFIVFASYCAISWKLHRIYLFAYSTEMRVVVPREDGLVLISFGMFIFACGLTHLMDVIVLFWNFYILAAAVLGACAIFSFLTAWLFVSERIRFLFKKGEIDSWLRP